MAVNVSKTEVFLFYKNVTVPVRIKIDNQKVLNKRVINVSGVIFDSKLTWANQLNIPYTKPTRQ
jgi:hypothetical protein